MQGGKDGSILIRAKGTGGDPCLKGSDLRRGRLWFLAGRHKWFLGSGQQLEEQGVLGISGSDNLTAVATGHEALKGLHGKLAFQFIVVMAAGAVLTEDGGDVLVEIRRGHGGDGGAQKQHVKQAFHQCWKRNSRLVMRAQNRSSTTARRSVAGVALKTASSRWVSSALGGRARQSR